MNFYKLTSRSAKVIPDWVMSLDLIPRPLSLCSKGNMKVFVKKLSRGDINTEKVYARLFRDKEYAFFLDSAKVDQERGRFSFMGCADGPLAYAVSYKLETRDLKVFTSDGKKLQSKLERGDTFFKWISQKISESHASHVCHLNCSNVPFDFFGGFIGNFGYEMKQECYSDTEFKHKTASNMADANFLFIDRFLAVDHIQGNAYLVVLHDIKDNEYKSNEWFQNMEMEIFNAEEPDVCHENSCSSTQSSLNVTCRHERQTYLENISKCLNYIKEGDSYELCLTTQFTSKLEASKTSSWNFYKELRKNNPAPYGAFFSFSDNVLACSSPELFMKVDGSAQVTMKPIKGTLSRVPFVNGQDYDAWLKNDLSAQQCLATSEKDLAENLMVNCFLYL
jgi:anthranilate/para-aminobenzoate synthase component I